MNFFLYQGTKGRGVRHVVYWKHTNESGVQPLKVNLIVYDNDVLQVKVSTILKRKIQLSIPEGDRIKFLLVDIRVLSRNDKVGRVHSPGGAKK